MTPANLSIKELQNIQNNTILADAFVTAYNALFHTDIQTINQISITEEVVQKINHTFNQWLLFLCNTYILNDIKNTYTPVELINTQPVTIHKKFIITNLQNQDNITKIITHKLSQYDLCDFYTIFYMTFGWWESQRVHMTRSSYFNNRKTNPRKKRINAIFTIPKRQNTTTKRAFNSIFGISVAEVFAGATFLLLKEQLDTPDTTQKQVITSIITKIQNDLNFHLKLSSAAKKAHNHKKTDSF